MSEIKQGKETKAAPSIGINIFEIQPHQITRDLSGKSFLIYGGIKTGKTTVACQFPKPLLIAFEKGYNMIPGVRPQPVNSWSEALIVKNQLLFNMQQHKMGQIAEPVFKTVVVDTADIAYDMCMKYILQKEKVDYLDDTSNKRGYAATESEFDTFFQEIVKAGYTLVAISHAETKQMKRNGESWERIQPSMNKRALKVIGSLVDLVGYADTEKDENGNPQIWLTMRGDSKYLEAGSRNPYTSDKILFTYDALLKDMTQAMDKIGSTSGTEILDTPDNPFADQIEIPDFESLKESIKKYAIAFNGAGAESKYRTIVEQRLGKDRMVSDCSESQSDILVVILDDLAHKADELGILVEAA